MATKARSLTETLGKRLIKLALTTYTMGNVLWVMRSNKYPADHSPNQGLAQTCDEAELRVISLVVQTGPCLEGTTFSI